MAIVEQDYLRRIVLKEKETEGTNNIGLIKQTVEYSLAHGYDVILEGILYFPRYGTMLQQLITQCPEHYIYYFDVSFEETLHRHATKPVADAYGEKEMRAWYHSMQITGLEGEQIIPESYSLDETVKKILTDTAL
ncbi:MAG: hypothetical protein JWN82_283 [Candidatus Saccharibacteria bacterium]|nr:hypothetical protein [Candidatus Saccharibacteria bacterium]